MYNNCIVYKNTKRLCYSIGIIARVVVVNVRIIYLYNDLRSINRVYIY